LLFYFGENVEISSNDVQSLMPRVKCDILVAQKIFFLFFSFLLGKSSRKSPIIKNNASDANEKNEDHFPFDGLYVINVPSRTDRLIDTLDMFRYFNLQPTVIDAFDILPFKNANISNPGIK
jgi:hypothetical protein